MQQRKRIMCPIVCTQANNNEHWVSRALKLHKDYATSASDIPNAWMLSR